LVAAFAVPLVVAAATTFSVPAAASAERPALLSFTVSVLDLPTASR
jgi:hypothetical protein